MFRRYVLGAMAGLTLGAVTANAQFVSNQPTAISTVKSVLDNGKDDQLVTLEGSIISQVKKDEFNFQDATGTIRVEIDQKVFAGQKVTPQNLIRIEGEVDKDFARPIEIDVHKLTIIK